MKSILGQPVDLDSALLKQALTHRSASKKNNERLEFLGDSILSLVISEWLYRHFPALSEGQLSRLRASLVKGETLAEVARRYQLGDALLLGSGELKSGGFDRSSVLADAVEALFGAVLIDKGHDQAREFILNALQPWLDKVDPEGNLKDPKSRLQEILQKRAMPLPEYTTVSESGKDHNKQFVVECAVDNLGLKVQSRGASRKRAEQDAADKMLKMLPFNSAEKNQGNHPAR
jgi:ribonuclease-3